MLTLSCLINDIHTLVFYTNALFQPRNDGDLDKGSGTGYLPHSDDSKINLYIDEHRASSKIKENIYIYLLVAILACL